MCKIEESSRAGPAPSDHVKPEKSVSVGMEDDQSHPPEPSVRANGRNIRDLLTCFCSLCCVTRSGVRRFVHERPLAGMKAEAFGAGEPCTPCMVAYAGR